MGGQRFDFPCTTRHTNTHTTPHHTIHTHTHHTTHTPQQTTDATPHHRHTHHTTPHYTHTHTHTHMFTHASLPPSSLSTSSHSHSLLLMSEPAAVLRSAALLQRWKAVHVLSGTQQSNLTQGGALWEGGGR